MATVQLNAVARDDSGKGAARKLRAMGKVPAVIYGHKREAQTLELDTRDLEKMLEHIVAESTVIELAIGGQTSKTLIREIQRHPFKRQILHVDFQELVAGEKVTVNIPIVLMGVAEGVRLGGGVMDQTLRELQIKVDPADIPNHFEVDVSALQVGGSLHVRDITVPGGVEILDDGDASVCVVGAPRAVVEAVVAPEAEAEASSEPEVIRKAKADEEAEEGGDKK